MNADNGRPDHEQSCGTSCLVLLVGMALLYLWIAWCIK